MEYVTLFLAAALVFSQGIRLVERLNRLGRVMRRLERKLDAVTVEE